MGTQNFDLHLLNAIKKALSSSAIYRVYVNNNIQIYIESQCVIDIPKQNFNKEWIRFKIQNDKVFNIPLMANSWRVGSDFIKHYEEMLRLLAPILRKMKIDDILDN
jgi:hypothetical protein